MHHAERNQVVIRSFRDLEVWQAAMDLAVDVYQVTDGLPQVERFVLTAQIRRSAISVPSNIAEGHAHRGDRTYLRHVRIALGSVAELDSQLELAQRLKFITAQQVSQVAQGIARTGQMLHALERSLERRAMHRGLTGVSLVCTVAAIVWRLA
jgi:four helix bundle protein